MEIVDEIEIEIFYTIERMKSIDHAILRHQNLDDPNNFMIEQYQELKKKLSKDLVAQLQKSHKFKFSNCSLKFSKSPATHNLAKYSQVYCRKIIQSLQNQQLHNLLLFLGMYKFLVFLQKFYPAF